MGGDWVGDDPAVKSVSLEVENIITILSDYETRIQTSAVMPYPKSILKVKVGHHIILQSPKVTMNVELGNVKLPQSATPCLGSSC